MQDSKLQVMRIPAQDMAADSAAEWVDNSAEVLVVGINGGTEDIIPMLIMLHLLIGGIIMRNHHG